MVGVLFDQLPVVVFHTLFTYLLTEEILFSLLNISLYLDDIIKSYYNYRLNFKSIHRSHFDLICQHILPKQVKVLILSDDKDTPGQSELFLSHYRIDQFINLQSLTLIQIDARSLEIINLHLNKLDCLRSFLLNSPMTIPLSLPLGNLRYLKLSQCSFDQFKNICLTASYLKTLDVTVIHRASNFELPCQLEYLTRLVLQIDGSSMSIFEMILLFIRLRRLKHLELRTKCHVYLANGNLWKIFVKDLITFKFIFDVELNSIEETLDTFRTPFWLKEKCWFIFYENKSLYTIPCAKYIHVNELFQPPKYTTSLKNVIFYDHVIKLTLKYQLITTCHRFSNITTLEIGCKDISIDILSAIVNLNGVKNLTLCSSMNKSKIKYLLNHMLCLQYLSIDTLMSERIYDRFQNSGRNFWDFLEKIKDFRFEQIHSLTICEYHIIGDSYTIHRLCHLFPNLERLDVSIRRLDNIIQLINSLRYLSSASFTLKFLSNDEILQSEWIIDRLRSSLISTFTWQLDGLCLRMWIKKESKEMIRKIDSSKTREFVWNWFNYILSQRSIVSMIISLILINHLSDILICMWTYLFSDGVIQINICLVLCQPATILLISEFCPIFFKKYDQTSVYLFGYAFVWIFTMIAYIFSDKWQLTFINKVNEKLIYHDNLLLLLFIHPFGYVLTGIGCMYCLLKRRNMYMENQWIIGLILYCVIGLCVCMIEVFFIRFVL